MTGRSLLFGALGCGCLTLVAVVLVVAGLLVYTAVGPVTGGQGCLPGPVSSRPEHLGRGFCPQQIPGLSVEGTAVGGGTFSAGASVPFAYGLRWRGLPRDVEVFAAVFRIHPGQQLTPVTGRDLVHRLRRSVAGVHRGQRVVSFSTAAAGLYGFGLVAPWEGREALLLIVPFALRARTGGNSP